MRVVGLSDAVASRADHVDGGQHRRSDPASDEREDHHADQNLDEGQTILGASRAPHALTLHDCIQVRVTCVDAPVPTVWKFTCARMIELVSVQSEPFSTQALKTTLRC